MDDQRIGEGEGLDVARARDDVAPDDAAPARDDDATLDHRLAWASHRHIETPLVYEPPSQRPPRDLSMLKDMGLVLFLLAAVGAGIVTWNAVGRVTSEVFAQVTVTSSPSPSVVASPKPSGAIAVVASPSPSPTAIPEPTPTPKPKRKPVVVNVVAKPKEAFASEKQRTWCAAAAVQIVLNINGTRPDTSLARQSQVHRIEVESTDRADSRNGGVGPLGMVATLNRLGKVDYELKIFKTRASALREAAKAISNTGHPVILLAWRGAHAWVMSGYKANADPTIFKDATVKGAYVLDPWYPRVSSIWGRSDPPGTYQDSAEMVRNYLPWRRPEGRYPGRDGRFLAILPVAP